LLEPDEDKDLFGFDLIADMPFNDKLLEFCNYLTETYMQEIFSRTL
jgi:hypothetical protein